MDDLLPQVRRFNRTVAQRIGALDGHFLDRGRPMAESRILWEIGEEGCDVRDLRALLDLDSGYLSRILRSLERAGLVTVGTSSSDRRVRFAHLTPAGLAERAILDERSDAVARSFLKPLSEAQRQRLVGAMSDVDRLLTASAVTIEPADPDSPAALFCLREYFAELDRRFETGFDPGVALPATASQLRPPAGHFLVAFLHSRPVGCGALKFADGAPAEIKRMWVSEAVRGLGIGRRLLSSLEALAIERPGAPSVVRLETNHTLTEAIAMYRSAGYFEVAAFNDEPHAHHWFEKALIPPGHTSPSPATAGEGAGG